MIVDRPFLHIQDKDSKIPFNQSMAKRLLLADSVEKLCIFSDQCKLGWIWRTRAASNLVEHWKSNVRALTNAYFFQQIVFQQNRPKEDIIKRGLPPHSLADLSIDNTEIFVQPIQGIPDVDRL